MPDWLIEGNPTILLALIVIAFCAMAAWRKTRRRWLLALAGVAVLLAISFKALDYYFESDSEQIERKITEVAREIKQPLDIGQMFNNISPEFRYGSHDKFSFKKFCEAEIRGRQVRSFNIWAYHTDNVSRAAKLANVRFQFKVDADGIPTAGFYLCKAEFKLDPDNQWRLRTFKIFPLNAEDQELNLPHSG